MKSFITTNNSLCEQLKQINEIMKTFWTQNLKLETNILKFERLLMSMINAMNTADHETADDETSE